MAGDRGIALWLRGAARGLGFGAAVTMLGTVFGMFVVMDMRFPPTPGNMIVAVLFPLALGALLGALAAPLLRLPGRWAISHTLVLTIAWTALERAFSMDPSRVSLWLAGPLTGLVLYALGLGVARWIRWLPWAVAFATLLAAVVVPVFVYRSRAAALEGNVVTAAPPLADAPDVVLVVLDTVRAASMPSYGYARNTTPEFDHLAAGGALFLDAVAPATWSLPSHASLFTGRFPSAHGAHEEHRFLARDSPTLAEVLAGAGYETRCFTANPHISGSFGLTRGFAWSDESWRRSGTITGFVLAFRVFDALGLGPQDKGGGRVAANFESWQRGRGAQARPTFTFVNFLEAHFPYHQVPRRFLQEMSKRSPRALRAASERTFSAEFGGHLSREEAIALREPTRDMYDAGVRYTDHLLGRVVSAIEKSGRLDRTVLVVLADHGEMVGEHGQYGHEGSIYEPVLHVPLLVRYPPRVARGSRVSQAVSTLGVFATILDLAGIRAPDSLQMGSLLPALEGRAAGQPVITERFVRARPGGPQGPLSMSDRRYRAYRSGPSKLVLTSKGDVHLFDVVHDPEESHDLAAEAPTETQRLGAELKLWEQALRLPPLEASVVAGPTPPLDDEALERLRALGYTN